LISNIFKKFRLNKNQKLGLKGECIAKEFYRKKYKFITKNFKFYKNEIDLIFFDVIKNELIFVEVKTRTSSKYSYPEDSVTNQKQENIRKAATGFLLKNKKYRDMDFRFDVISIIIEDGKTNIVNFENAF
jgi:putative endonuclease